MNPQGNDQIKGMAVTQFVKIFEWIKVVSRKSFQLDQALGGGVGGGRAKGVVPPKLDEFKIHGVKSLREAYLEKYCGYSYWNMKLTGIK